MSGQAFFKSSSRSFNLNVETVTPKQLSKVFKIPVDDLMLQDENKNVIFVENNCFDPSLIANKTYEVMDNSENNQQLSVANILNVLPSEEQRTAIVQKVADNGVVKSLNGPAIALSNIIPACRSIEHLLIKGATDSDYSLISSSYNQFGYLLNPKSMKVSVTQVAQDMYKLIQSNKSDLDYINLKMAFVSGQFNFILPAFLTKNKDIISQIADQMVDATKVCVKKSAECTERAEQVLNVINELVKAILGAQSDIQNADKSLLQSIEQLGEKIKLVQRKFDRRNAEVNEQQKKFESAYEEHREQQKRGGCMWKGFCAGFLDNITFGNANARSGMNDAYKNAAEAKIEEKDLLMKFRDEFGEVEDELTNLKIRCKIDQLKKEGLKGTVEAIDECIKRISDLTAMVQNMQGYFQAINNLIKVSFKDNAELFIQQAQNENATALDYEQMMAAVVDIYMIFSVVQTFSTIFSIAASHEAVQSSLSRGTSYLSLTPEEAKAKQQELDSNEIDEEVMNLESVIKAELEKQTELSHKNIGLFIDSSIKAAKYIEN